MGRKEEKRACMYTIATEESDGERRHQTRDAAAAPPQDGGGDQIGRIPGPGISLDRRRGRCWSRLFGRPFTTIFSSDASRRERQKQ
jgi:hypothetical protein